MKKSLLNIAVSIALTSAIYSGSVLSNQAYANNATSDDLIAENDSNIQNTSENYIYPGMGIGAATGAVIAGPVGLIIGGFVGAMIGTSHEEDITQVLTDENSSLADNVSSDDTSDNYKADFDHSELGSLQVAQIGEISTVVDDASNSKQDELIDILTTDLSLDIYFRSGSANIESFYPARLTAIADLLESMDQLELHLDGYTDRRGNKSQNIALANQRIEKVRQQLIDSGVDENRINSKAFGEMKMVSNAGDLEGYTFDRKVVIRFERSSADSIHAMTEALSETAPVSLHGCSLLEQRRSGCREPEADESVISVNDESTDSIVANTATRF